MITVYVSITNQDGRLTPAQWAAYVADVHAAILARATRLHAVWYTAPAAPAQGACWSLRIDEQAGQALRADLATIRAGYGQPRLTWAETDTILFP